MSIDPGGLTIYQLVDAMKQVAVRRARRLADLQRFLLGSQISPEAQRQLYKLVRGGKTVVQAVELLLERGILHHVGISESIKKKKRGKVA